MKVPGLAKGSEVAKVPVFPGIVMCNGVPFN